MAPAPSAGHGRAESLLVLAAVCLSLLALPFNFTGPAVAMPAIARSLGGDPIALNWITNAFMLCFGSTLMIAGALADTFGRKRLFLIGQLVFLAASLALTQVRDLLWLDLLRALQGGAGAAAFSAGLAALAQEFDGPARTRAFSLIGTTFGVGLAFGPLLSGWLVEAAGWQAIFLGTAILAAIAFGFGWRFMRESRDPGAAGLDWSGAASFTAALSLLTYAVLLAPEQGWGSAWVVGLLAGAVALGAAFVAIEKRVARPMLDLSLFRFPRFVGVQLLAAAPAYSFVVLLILLPLRFVGIEGWGGLGAGWMMMALCAPMLVVPMLAALLTRWVSAGMLCGAGLLVAAGGLVLLAGVPPGVAAAAMVPPLLVIGLGISLPWGLMDALAVSVVPKERAGMAAGIFSTTRVAGEGIALAVVGAILAGFARSWLAGVGPADPAALTLAAQRLAMGDLAQAAVALPQAGPALLVQAYGDAFHALCFVLAAITVVTAAVVFGFLSRPAQVEPALQPAEAAE
ncbi:MAG: MFS transporter [Inquilinus limosus]|uniref:MFS transporter n=1 Tax=Inquilinus limosus TaxID=171674 RepID=A0A952KJJ9_9PROT|nr:MFS transporter [Inquilinus limosus]